MYAFVDQMNHPDDAPNSLDPFSCGEVMNLSFGTESDTDLSSSDSLRDSRGEQMYLSLEDVDPLIHSSESDEDRSPTDALAIYPSASYSIVPNKYDILCGRSKMAANHVGNKRYRKTIAQYRERYQNATNRNEKSLITNEVIAKLCEEGGRFLKLDPVTKIWYDVGRAYAYEKVSHALRSAKHPNKKCIKKQGDAEALKRADDIFRTLLSEQQAFVSGLLLQEEQTGNEHLELTSVDGFSSAILA